MFNYMCRCGAVNILNRDISTNGAHSAGIYQPSRRCSLQMISFGSSIGQLMFKGNTNQLCSGNTHFLGGLCAFPSELIRQFERDCGQRITLVVTRQIMISYWIRCLICCIKYHHSLYFFIFHSVISFKHQLKRLMAWAEHEKSTSMTA